MPTQLTYMIGGAFFAGTILSMAIMLFFKIGGDDIRACLNQLTYTAVCMCAGIGLMALTRGL